MVAAPVLYVEDEEDDVYFLQVAFRKAQVAHPLKVVNDGQQAIDYLTGAGSFADREQNPLPCLVLLDLNLPRISGMEVLQWMRNQPQLKTLPVVVYTSSSNEADKASASRLGIQDYLVKQASPPETAKQVEGLKARWLEHA